ncbi:MAG TPA: hypothetical protein VF160_07340 [Candidatus Dormibacteraeota bacterium]
MSIRRLSYVFAPLVLIFAAAPAPAAAAGPPGTQSNDSYAASYAANGVTNTFATTQRTSCYTPEVAYFASDGPNDGYTGMTGCAGVNTGENLGPYATQYNPAPGPMLVKDHSESDLRVDPTNPKHLIGSSKWFVSAEGYNHVLGFYESFDGGRTWPSQGHIPGYEGWTDNTDPVGAFDGFGNYYEFILAYQFSYDASGHHDFNIGGLPNPGQAAEVVAVSVRPHGAKSANQWISTRGGSPDIIASYQSVGGAPDKQWITIDNNPASPHYNTIYAMWVVFDGPFGSKPFVSTAQALPDGTHTAWTAPQQLPTLTGTSADTYLLPHVDPAGNVWTSVTHFPSTQQRSTYVLAVDFSTDGGATWQGPLTASGSITMSPLIYPNTTYRSGIADSFAVGNHLSNGHYPLYIVYEDYSSGFANEMLIASYDGGNSWTAPIRVNDNAAPAQEHQGNLAVAADGTVMVNFYDRRLPCPSAGSAEAAAAGLALDTSNPNYAGTPPYGAADYCVNASMQFFTPQLGRIGQNIRISQNTFDPQLNSPHPGCASCTETFLGDYFGNTGQGTTSFSSFASTYSLSGNNDAHYQQQVIATLRIP